MQEKKSETANKNPKKANRLEHHSIEHILDESVSKYVVFNILLRLIGYTNEKNGLIGHIYKNTQTFTYPPTESFSSTGLEVSSKLPRFSDLYTLISDNFQWHSADLKSIYVNKPVHFTKSVTQWFTKGDTLVEGLFWTDVKAPFLLSFVELLCTSSPGAYSILNLYSQATMRREVNC